MFTLEKSLPPEVVHELLTTHGIQASDFVSDSITLGCDAGWIAANERYAKTALEKASAEAIGNGELASEQRRINRNTSLRLKYTPENNWNIYGVHLDSTGALRDDLVFLGHRKHPSNRTGEDNEIKFDARGVETLICLPALSYHTALELLSEHGFRCSSEEYSPQRAWSFVLLNPSVALHIEESALKAYAATSYGQLAIGLNGINTHGQTKRSDTLRKQLQVLARGRRSLVVRFDYSESGSSEREVKKLASKLTTAGADAGFYTFKKHGPHKTDDYVAAVRSGYKDPIGNQLNIRLDRGFSNEDYTRLRRNWNSVTIDREFTGYDIASAVKQSRLIALVGATGTGKTEATVQFLEQSEQASTSQRQVVLGLYARRSLVHKGAYEFGVRDMSADRGTAERDMGLHEGRTARQGLFCCAESIYKGTGEMDLWKWSFLLEEDPRPAVLVLDEITQTLINLLHRGTSALIQKRSVSVQCIERLIKNPCVTVIIADAGLGDLELEWLHDLTGLQPLVINSSYRRERQIYLGELTRETRSSLGLITSQYLRTGRSVWVGFGEKAKLLEFMDRFTDFRSLTITAESAASQEVTEFVSDTNKYGPQYQLIGFSPSLSSGVSMVTGDVALTAIHQQYAMTAEDALQSVNRARRADVRVILYSKTLPTPSYLGTKEKGFTSTVNAYQDLFQWDTASHHISLMSEIDRATAKYFFSVESRHNYEVSNNEWVLRSRLKQEGYELRDFYDLSIDPDSPPIARSIRQAKEYEATLRERLLGQLVFGKITLEEAQKTALEAIRGGLICDLANTDPTASFQWLHKIGFTELARLEAFNADCPEFKEIERRFHDLNAKEVRSFRQATTRVNVPGPEDQLSLSSITPLFKIIGYKAERRQRRYGKKRQSWYYPKPVTE